MADVRRSFKHRIADGFELPKDIVLGMPKMTMVGNLQVFIENHHGIIEFSDQLVRININLGEIVIRGTGLVLRNIFTEEILIEGTIEKIEFSV